MEEAVFGTEPEVVIPQPKVEAKKTAGTSKETGGIFARIGKRIKAVFTSDEDNFKAEAVENTTGLISELQQMLSQCTAGEHVNPKRYEVFIKEIIRTGQYTAEDKMLYLIAGLAVKNPKGQTLLNKSQINHITNLYMNVFPQVDFLTRFRPMKDGKKSDEAMPAWFTENLVNNVFKYQGGKYDKQAVTKFMIEEVMPHGSVQSRSQKAAKFGAIDYTQDTKYNIPVLDPSTINSTIVQAGSKFTAEAFKNGFEGYDEYFRGLTSISSKSPEDTKKRATEGFSDTSKLMTKAIKSWIAFESVFNKRTDLADEVNSGTIKEMKSTIRTILLAYKVPEDTIAKYLDYTASANIKEQKSHAKLMKGFDSFFDGLISDQGSKIMIEAVQGVYKKPEPAPEVDPVKE